jgi:hypothetical protein
MTSHLTLLCPVLGAMALCLGAAPSRAATDTELAEALRKLDRGYEAHLEDLLTKAQINDAGALMADIKARLAVIGKYRSAGLARSKKQLMLVGSLTHAGELVVDKDGIRWRDCTGPSPTDLNLNGVPWEPKWFDRGTRSDTLGVSMEKILGWRVAGKVSVRKIPRGPGITGFKIASKTPRERSTFKLRIDYQAPVGNE